MVTASRMVIVGKRSKPKKSQLGRGFMAMLATKMKKLWLCKTLGVETFVSSEFHFNRSYELGSLTACSDWISEIYVNVPRQ